MAAKPVKLDLPNDLVTLLDPSGEHLDRKVAEALVLFLFQQNQLSSGRGAELLGIPRHAFFDLLNQYDIPYFRQTIDEVLEDAEVAAAETTRNRPA